MMHEKYLAVVVSALVVLLLGCWNPKALQLTQNGVPSGHPNYMWLALLSLLAGLLTAYAGAMKY
jgi:hypothetical protein